MDKQMMDERQKATHKALMKLLENLDVNDPEWDKKYRAIQGMYREINQDNLNQVNEESNILEAGSKRDENETNKFLGIFQSAGGWIMGGITAGISIFEIVSLNKRYKISSKYEEENAYLTQTDKATIQDGLKSKPTTGSKLKFW